MWMAQRQAIDRLQESSAEMGEVTLSGAQTGVALDGERRNVKLCLPGGYHWTPSSGDAVLVVKSGAEQAPCVVGVAEQNASPQNAGEVYLSVAKGSGILLKKDGTIQLEGDLCLTGAVKISGSLTLNGEVVNGGR